MVEGFIAITVTVLIVVIVWNSLSSKATNQKWERAASQLGLKFEGSGFFSSRRISGRYKGFNVAVDTFPSDKRTWTRFRISYPSLGIGLRIKKQGFFSGFWNFFRDQDIEVGDAAFDDAVVIEGRSPNQVIAFLTPARRLRIRNLFISYPESVIEDSQITCQTDSLIKNAHIIVSSVRNITALAWHLTGLREEDAVIERSMKARDAGRIEEALEVISEKNVRTDPVTTRAERITIKIPPEIIVKEEFVSTEKDRIKGELLYLTDKKEEAKKVFEHLLIDAPEDPEIRKWVEKGTDQPQTTTPASQVALDVASICQTLFDPRKFSSDVNQTFETQYKGKGINWKGKLHSVEACSYDHVFGGMEGTRATLEVAEVPSVFYGKTKVFAVLQLPKSALVSLKESIGKEFTLSGQLLKVDGIMSNIYIADSALQ